MFRDRSELLMGIDAVAVLPALVDVEGGAEVGGWQSGAGPQGVTGVWRTLLDGTLLNLGIPIVSPDSQLYQAAQRWMGPLPDRIWVFPDVVTPEAEAISAVLDATREAGRWVDASGKTSTPLAKLGFSADEESRLQADLSSGDTTRVGAAITEVNRRSEKLSAEEAQALLESFLGHS